MALLVIPYLAFASAHSVTYLYHAHGDFFHHWHVDPGSAASTTQRYSYHGGQGSCREAESALIPAALDTFEKAEAAPPGEFKISLPDVSLPRYTKGAEPGKGRSCLNPARHWPVVSCLSFSVWPPRPPAQPPTPGHPRRIASILRTTHALLI
jgi:hypothetical protein